MTTDRAKPSEFSEIKPSRADFFYMQSALSLAFRHKGETWPNPTVGCVIVKDNLVVGRGVTAVFGRPHAETLALAQAGDQARLATAYVTLEPCAHQGITPPCAEALIKAGVKRVFIALQDPDPRVSGLGISRLKQAGIEVHTGLLAEECREINAGFFSRILRNRPLVTLKTASTLDGRIATRTGESKWLSSAASRQQTHALRGEHDAIAVGAETALRDNPGLTCRVKGYKQRPLVRVVFDSALRLSPDLTLLQPSSAPLWIFHTDKAPPERKKLLSLAHVRFIEVPTTKEGFTDPLQALEELAKLGITSLLLEGGARLATSFLKQNLIDRIIWVHTGALMGKEALPAIDNLAVTDLSRMPRFRPLLKEEGNTDIISRWII